MCLLVLVALNRDDGAVQANCSRSRADGQDSFVCCSKAKARGACGKRGWSGFIKYNFIKYFYHFLIFAISLQNIF